MSHSQLRHGIDHVRSIVLKVYKLFRLIFSRRTILHLFNEADFLSMCVLLFAKK